MPFSALQQVTLRHWSSHQPPQLGLRTRATSRQPFDTDLFRRTPSHRRYPLSWLAQLHKIGGWPQSDCPLAKQGPIRVQLKLMMHLLRDSACHLPSAPVPKHRTQGSAAQTSLKCALEKPIKDTPWSPSNSSTSQIAPAPGSRKNARSRRTDGQIHRGTDAGTRIHCRTKHGAGFRNIELDESPKPVRLKFSNPKSSGQTRTLHKSHDNSHTWGRR